MLGIFEESLNSGLLRRAVPKGIVQTVYLQDGLHYKNFTSMQQARHDSLYLDDGLGLDDPDQTWMLWVMDWVWGFWCVLHIASLALKWGST